MTNQRNLFFLLFMSIASTICAQSYVDVVKVSYSNVINASFEDSNAETNLSLFNASLTIPIPITEKTAFITGVDFAHQGLDLFPNQFSRTLGGITFKAGVSLTHSDRWSGTYVLLPKIASEDFAIEGDAFFIGGIALLKFQKNEHIQYRFGVYVSEEAFGTIVTPIIGGYYKSETMHWETTLNLPVNGDVNYEVNDRFKIGAAFEAAGSSFVLDTDAPQELYVQTNSLEIGPYFQHAIAKNILLRLQTGYSSVDYQVYAVGDELPFRLAAFEFGDSRTRLNPKMSGNLFIKAGITYRFDIPEKETIN
ncbi:DUF6268 family outer membrane beta-barrel protein [Dokdonia sp.]|uniref:DUF6268 family outer membrane beta-barrel protein n=1 Tax=Dokdonia sp. TaxID=2024995 RepID=UPI0032659FB9